MAAMRRLREFYTPGQAAPLSGLYRVHHARKHRTDHNVVAISGDEFPGCRECTSAVRYTLQKQAAYINHDFDLSAPPEVVVRRSIKLV